MKKLFALKKNGLIVSQILTTFANYLLWAIILKPMGLVETVGSAASSASKMGFGAQGKIAADGQMAAAAMTGVYGVSKTVIYLCTTGLFILMLSKNGAYKQNSNGKIVLGLTTAALVVDFLNMTILPAFPLYMLATLMLVMSKDVEEIQEVDFKQAA